MEASGTEAPKSNAVGARIEAPKAPRGVVCEEGVSPSSPGKGLIHFATILYFFIFEPKKASFGAFWD